MKKILFMFFAAVIMPLLLIACGGSKNTGSGGKTIVRVGLAGVVTDISPFGAPVMINDPILFSLYQPLFVFEDMRGEIPIPAIGKSLQVINPLTFRVELYNNIYDTDGNHLTASDVVYSFNVSKGSGNQTASLNMASATAISDYLVEIVMVEARPGAMDNMLNRIFVVTEAAHRANRETPAGTTQYKVSSFVSGASCRLEKQENFWQVGQAAPLYAANVDIIDFSFIPEATQATIAMETGTLHMFIEMAPREASRFLPGGSLARGFAVDSFPSNTGWVLVLNETAGRLTQDINLRRAIMHAIDRDEIIRLVFDGAGVVNRDYVSRQLKGHNDVWLTQDYFNFDLNRARSYLAQSGYRGETLRLQAVAQGAAQLEVMQAQLQRIGINTAIQTFESATWNDLRVAGIGEWDISIGMLGGSFIQSAWRVYFHAGNFTTGYPINGSRDPMIRELLEAVSNAATFSPQTIEAFHSYMMQQYQGMGLISQTLQCVHVDTIMNIAYNDRGRVVPGASTFTPGYNFFE